MTVKHLFSTGLALFLALPLYSAGPPLKTDVRLLLSAETARPGETVWAGVEMKMAPGWHTYWRNSGESGAPTTMDWRLPEGVQAGEIHWPSPEKYAQSGLTTYVYHEEVMLLIPLTIAADVPVGNLEIRGRVDWLECEEICVPGSGEVSARLTVGQESGASAHAERIEAWRQRLPESRLPWQMSARRDAPANQGNRAVLIEVAGAVDDFYPFAAEGFEVQADIVKLESAPDRTLLRKEV
jgi:thiol:disulfide interchange protein DsbD